LVSFRQSETESCPELASTLVSVQDNTADVISKGDK
jgi:hypothetical protein